LQAIYKQEISTISTSSPVRLQGESDEAPATVAIKPAARTVIVERRRRIRSSG
jgi:hypothetical protein